MASAAIFLVRTVSISQLADLISIVVNLTYTRTHFLPLWKQISEEKQTGSEEG